MACLRPLRARRTPGGEILIGTARGDEWSLELPCGGCIGCRMDRARSWKVRIMHEASLYDSNLCLTLTYSDESLPPSLSLEYPDFAGFMKRLRRRFVGDREGPDGGRPIRFFVSGEYGSLSGRAHWHAILFNVRLPDMRQLHNGKFSSVVVEDLWQQKGSVVVDRLSSAAAAYVAGYVMKKQKERIYAESVVNLATGELSGRRPPFCVMSRRPGIGAWWFRRFGRDVFPHDFTVLDGEKQKVPRYYLERYKEHADAAQVEEILHMRYLRAQESRAESTPERRAVREERALLMVDHFEKRGL